MNFINNQTTLYPHLRDYYIQFNEFYQARLWHQLTDTILVFVSNPQHVEGDNFFQLYQEFIRNFEKKINQLKFAQIISYIVKTISDPSEAKAFLASQLEKRTQLGDQATVFIKIQLAQIHLGQKETEATKQTIDEIKEVIDNLSDIETCVLSNFYLLVSEYHELCGPAEEYYKNALMYLAYTPLESLSEEARHALAVNMSLAALTGDGVYNFGEVLATPILKSLQGTENQWLSEIMYTFYSGDIETFNAILFRNKDAIESQPALVSRMDFLKEKIILICLMVMSFERPVNERVLTFVEISNRTQLPIDQVEWVAMRAMSQGLIRGVIDEIDQVLTVSWIQPRVLQNEQIQQLSVRLGEWAEKAKKQFLFMEDQTPQLFI